MSRRFLVLNVLLLAVAAAAGVYIARELTTPPRKLPPARAAKAESGAAATTASGEASASRSAGSYTVVAARNLFSPTRSETPPAPATPVKTGPPPPKPNLFGVVVREGTLIAYLEDPTTKRVAGYRLGDSIAGGTVDAIDADHVVLKREDGPVDLRLRDPAKPRPPAAPTPGAPGAPGQPGVQGIPPQAAQPGAPQPGVLPNQPPPRRPVPPNMLRRLAPGSQNDAPQP